MIGTLSRSLAVSTALAALMLAGAWPGTVAAAPESGKTRVFALVVGVNETAEKDLQPLKYADDDAVRYNDMFESLGAQTYLLASPDENTRRLHPITASLATRPTRASFDTVVARVASDVKAARKLGDRAVVYLLYAGHGSRDDRTGKGFLTLQDARLSATALQRAIVDKIDATEFHLIIDACNSGFLTVARGPGGERRRLSGFVSEVATGARDPRVGLLFATSSMRKTFEYEGYQAGVFSHLVRSGLMGAADFDLDGQVTYEEIQKFVSRATTPVANEKYRPQVHALRPTVTRSILDIRPALARSQLIMGTGVAAAHHMIEDSNGVRLVDFHNAAGATMHLVRPTGAEPLTLSLAEGGSEEHELPRDVRVIDVATLTPRPHVIAARGAADNAFRQLFALPFDKKAVAQVMVVDQDYLGIVRELEQEREAERAAKRQQWAKATWVAGGVVALAGAGSMFAASREVTDPGPKIDQFEADARNDRARDLRTAGGVAFGVAGLAAITGAVLYWWPSDDGTEANTAGGTDVGISFDGASLHGRF